MPFMPSKPRGWSSKPQQKTYAIPLPLAELRAARNVGGSRPAQEMNDERIRRMRIVALVEKAGLFELEPDKQISVLLLLRELRGQPPLDQDALDRLKAAVLEHEAAKEKLRDLEAERRDIEAEQRALSRKKRRHRRR